MTDHFRTLDLPPDATPEQIKERYRVLVRIFHPDRYRAENDRAFAEEKLKEINHAYAALMGRAGELGTPPAPLLSPPRLDFGAVLHGETVVRRVQVSNGGGEAQSLRFDTADSLQWFNILRGERVHPSRPLPMLLEIEARTDLLAPGEVYTGWIDVHLDDATVRLPLTVTVVQPENALLAGGRWIGPLFVLLLALALFLGYRTMRGWESAPPSPDTAQQDAVGAAQPPETPSPTAGAGPAATTPTATDPSSITTRLGEPVVIAVSVASSTARPTGSPSSELEANESDARIDTIAGSPSAIVSVTVSPTVPPSSAPSATPTGTAKPTATARPTATATHTPTSSQAPRPSATATHTPTVPTTVPTTVPATVPATVRPTATPSPTAEGAATATAEATATVGATATPLSGTVTEDGGILFTVPLEYQMNARAATSVESASLELMEKGSVHAAQARTVDTAWLQFALADGRLAWVFTDSLQVERDLFATLPVIYTAPAADVETDTAEEAAPATSTVAANPAIVPAPAEATALPDTGKLPRTHVVRNGDFLKQMALGYYGDAELWTLIYDANRAIIGGNPNILTAGQELVIPPLE